MIHLYIALGLVIAAVLVLVVLAVWDLFADEPDEMEFMPFDMNNPW